MISAWSGRSPWVLAHYINAYDAARHAIRPLWTDRAGGCTIGRLSGSGAFALDFWGLAVIVVYPATRRGEFHLPAGEAPEDTLWHLWNDQVIPRLLDLEGYLVLHAGGVRLGAGAIAALGPSGRGKSTLVASLASDEQPLLNDDSLVVMRDGAGFAVAPTYAGVRLLPDALARLAPDLSATSPVSHYAPKRRLPLDEAMSADPAPLIALFFLDAPAEDGRIAVGPVAPAEACMEIVAQSFALDPTDLARAALRLGQAADLAARVPAFRLRYPHDFDRLPEVHDALRRAVGDARALSRAPRESLA